MTFTVTSNELGLRQINFITAFILSDSF